jgi:hypothetical protein
MLLWKIAVWRTSTNLGNNFLDWAEFALEDCMFPMIGWWIFFGFACMYSFEHAQVYFFLLILFLGLVLVNMDLVVFYEHYLDRIFSTQLVWPVPLAQVWTHLQHREIQLCEHCFAMYVSIFLNKQIWKEFMLELNGKPFKCCHILNWFFRPKPDILEFISNFRDRNHF